MVYYSRSLLLAFHVLVVTFLAAASTTNAFIIVSSSSTSSVTSSSSRARHDSHLLAAANDNNMRNHVGESIRNIAATTMLTLGLLLLPSNDAFAAQDRSIYDSQPPVYYSSSVQLSAVIQTMDFSLPSSYDNLSDPVADGKAELVKTEVVITGGGGSKRAAVKQSDTAKDEAAAARAERVAQRSKALDAVLNSSSSSKEEAADALAERVAQRKAAEAEQAQLDELKRKEIDANIKAVREEKAAKRAAAAQAERDAAALANDEAEDAKYKGVKFMDTSMPTY